MKDNFKFWVPLDLQKAYDEKGNEVMKIGGIASTSAKDSDGEFLDPNGFNLDYFNNQGFLNYHHQAKNNPSAIIGEPTKAEIRKEGLYIEGLLYADSELAKSVYDTAKVLEKNSKTRRLGFSIEGKATKRKSMDEKHPDYKIIQKADITGCAVTFSPKNPKTFLDIIKGNTEDTVDEYDDETLAIIKALEAGSVTGRDTTNVSTAGSGAALKSDGGEKLKKINTLEEDEEEEKTNKNKKLTKAEVYEQIFTKQPDISLSDAEKVFHYIKKINMAKNLEKVEASDVEKALQLLDKAQDLIKGGTEQGIEVPKFSKDDEADSIKKANDYFVLATKDAEFSKSEVMSTLIEKGGYPTDVVKKAFGKKDKEEKEDSDEEKVEKFKKKKAECDDMEKALIEKGIMPPVAKEDKKGKAKKKEDEDEDDDKDDMKKGLQDVGDLIKQKNESVGVILKAVYDEMLSVKEIVSSIKEENVDLKKALDDSNETITGLKTELGDLTKALDEPPVGARKSTMVTGRERNFQDGNTKQDLTKGGATDKNTISIRERNKVLNALDEATFAKGMDTEFCEAMTTFESQGNLTGHILNRLKEERGIVITK